MFRLRGLSVVAMMEAADHRLGHDAAALWRIDLPRPRRIILQRLMSPRGVVVVEVVGQDSRQVLFIQDDDVVEALASDGCPSQKPHPGDS